METHALSKRARDALGLEYRYSLRERLPNEAPPRTFTPARWEPRHPDLQFVIVRADKSLQIKSRGM